MNSGKFVFAQVMEYFPRYLFAKAVKMYNGDYHSRNLTCYNQCLHLLFGQLSGCRSLRDICLLLKAHQKTLYHLGFTTTVDSSSLSRANETRDARILEYVGEQLIHKVRPKYAQESIPDVHLPDWEVLAIDSTTMSCSITLASWALGKRSKGGVKMHTVLDLRGSIPDTIYITDSLWHDSNFLDIIDIHQWAIYTMDRAYVDFEALYRIHKADAYFVTRAKRPMKYEIVEKGYNINTSIGIVADDMIRLTNSTTLKYYPELIRMVKYYDDENDEVITFITNNLELGSLVVANIYRNRWQIETFFKWIKQNLVIKSFWGYSENAVKTQLWIAIIAYLMLALIKAELKSPFTITEIATIVEVSILSKADLRELLSPQNEPSTENQNDKELLLNF